MRKLNNVLSRTVLAASLALLGSSALAAGHPATDDHEPTPSWVWAAKTSGQLSPAVPAIGADGTLYAVLQSDAAGANPGVVAIQENGAGTQVMWHKPFLATGNPDDLSHTLYAGQSPVLDETDQRLYVTTAGGLLSAYDTTAGNRQPLWTVALPEAGKLGTYYSAPALIEDVSTSPPRQVVMLQGCSALESSALGGTHWTFAYDRAGTLLQRASTVTTDCAFSSQVGSAQHLTHNPVLPPIIHGGYAYMAVGQASELLFKANAQGQIMHALTIGKAPGGVQGLTLDDSTGLFYAVGPLRNDQSGYGLGVFVFPVTDIIGGTQSSYRLIATLKPESQISHLGDATSLVSPVLANHTLYVQGDNGTLFALDIGAVPGGGNATQKWSFKTAAQTPFHTSYATPVLDNDGTIYFAGDPSSDPGLYALDAATGHPRWSYTIKKLFEEGAATGNAGVRSMTLSPGGVLYVGATKDALDAMPAFAAINVGTTLADGPRPKLGGDLANTGRSYRSDATPADPVASITVDGHIDEINEGKPVVLDASASSDPGNAALAYEWSIVSATAQVKLSPRDAARATLSRIDIPTTDLPMQIKLTVKNPTNGKTGTASYAFTLKAVGKPAGAGLVAVGQLQGKPLAKGTVVEAYVTQQGSSTLVGTKASYEVDVEGDTYLWPARLGSKLEQGNRQRGWLVGEKQGDKIALVPGSSHGNRVWIPGDGQTRYELHIDTKTGPWGWAPVSGTLQVSPQWLNVKQLDIKLLDGNTQLCGASVAVTTDPGDGTLNPYTWPLVAGNELKRACAGSQGDFAVGELIGSGEISPVAGSSYRNLFWKKVDDSRNLRLTLTPSM